MSGIVQVGGVALASHDSGTDKVSLDSGTVFPDGHVLQVVNDAGVVETTSDTELWNTRVSDLSVLITPSHANNKILLIGNAPCEINAGERVALDFYKNASDVTETWNLTGLALGLGTSYVTTGYGQWILTPTFMDTAGTTNEITYGLSLKGTGGTVYAGQDVTGNTSLTAIEIKA